MDRAMGGHGVWYMVCGLFLTVMIIRGLVRRAIEAPAPNVTLRRADRPAAYWSLMTFYTAAAIYLIKIAFLPR